MTTNFCKHSAQVFAEKCLANEKLKSMFPKSINLHKMKKRKNQIFKVNFSKTKRYRQSSIPYMINLLNIKNNRKMKILKQSKAI